MSCARFLAIVAACGGAGVDGAPLDPPSRRHGPPNYSTVAYLNFDGGTFTCDGPGNDDSRTNLSGISCDWGAGPAVFAPFDASLYDCPDRASCVARVVERVKALWLGFAVHFTTERPPDGHYEMVAIGGGDESPAAAGSALQNCDNWWPDNVAFAFAHRFDGDMCAGDRLVTVISQELAHSLGVCHNDACDGGVVGVMCPQVGPGRACRSDWRAGCAVDTCDCYAGCADPRDVLMRTVGAATPDSAPPRVAFTSPADGATVTPPFAVALDAGDDRALASVTLSKDGAAIATFPGGGPYVATIDNAPPGAIALDAVALDAAGNRAEASIEVTVPAPERDAGAALDAARAAGGDSGGCAVGGDTPLPLIAYFVAGALAAIRSRRGLCRAPTRSATPRPTPGHEQPRARRRSP